MSSPLSPVDLSAFAVLVVDDSPTVRLYHRSVLTSAGFVVSEAENGYDAFEQVLLQPFDALVVDVNMPVMDGYSLLESLRAEPSCAGLPVIMVSSEAEERDAEQAYRRGADRYLVKPVSRERLTAEVTEVVLAARTLGSVQGPLGAAGTDGP